MKKILRRIKAYLPLLALATILPVAQNLSAGVTFSVTPATVSNTYSGTITLQIGGLTNGETVVIQKYVDLNGNGVIDAGEWLGQQFNLTDGQAGMVIGGVTNFNVPGDGNTNAGQITATLSFNNGDFSQNISAKYLFKLSSPTGSFAPITNGFAVTSFPYAQKFTGTVVSNGTTTVAPNAVVLLFPAGGNGSPVGGAVADSSGSYTIPAPPGTYSAIAFKSGFVFNLETAPALTLAAGATLTTNVTTTSATSSLSGQVVDANNSSLGLPGVFMTAQATNGLIGVGFTDANGNFNLSVAPSPSQWGISVQDTSLLVHGYVGAQNKTGATAGQSGIVLAVSKATALFYGKVEDNLGNPVSGMDIYVNDDNGLYQTDGYSDANGNYAVGAIGGLNNDLWQVEISGGTGAGSYLFSQPGFDDNGGTNISAGEAVAVNFTAIAATNTISGTLKDGSGKPFAGIGVYANATIAGVNYNQSGANTDSNGDYSLNVASGTWNVGVNTGGGSDSLPTSYFCPAQTVMISNNNAVVNFIATVAPYTISGSLEDNNGKPIAGVAVYASATTTNGANYNQNATTDANGNYTLNVIAGTWQVGVNSCTDCGESLPGNYLDPQYQTVVVTSSNATANFIAVLATQTISGSLTDGSGNPIAGIGVYANATINGTNYNQNAITGSNGSFSLNVINGDWQVGIFTGGGGDNLPADYLSLQSQTVEILTNNATVPFTAILATNYITGNVKANGTNVVGVGVGANVTINGEVYSQYADTDANGNYSLRAANGIWNIYVNCGGGSDSLENILGSGNFTCPNNQSNSISGNNATNNFTVKVCGGVSISPSLPTGESGVFYEQFVQASSCNPPFTWALLSSPPPGLQWNPTNGEVSGIPTNAGAFQFSVQATDAIGLSATQTVSLTLNAPVQVKTISIPNGTNGVSYSQPLQAGGGVTPYLWALASGSANLPAQLSLSQAGLLSGIPTNTGTFGFTVVVTDYLGGTSTQALTLTVSPSSPLQVATTSLPAATQNVFYSNALAATGGQPPYSWSLVAGAGFLPQGLTLGTNGVVSGTSTNSGTNTFTVRVTDAAGATNSQLLTLAVIAQQGSLQVMIAPEGAINAGAKWQVDNGALESSGAVVPGLQAGTHTVSFSTIAGWTTPASQAVTITNGLTTTASGTYLQLKSGSLKVTLLPASAVTTGAKWQVDGGKLQSSGAIVTNLTAGNHTVSFNTISGWLAPASETVVVNPSTTATNSATYIAVGSLQVTLTPAAAIAGGAQWQVDFNGNWQNSGATVSNLVVGNHTVSYGGIEGEDIVFWATPVNQTVVIKAKTVTKATGAYTFNEAGVYNGLFMPPDVTFGTAGMLSGLTVTAAGTYSGKLLISNSTNAFSGGFNSAGEATNYITRKANQGGRLVLSLWLQPDGVSAPTLNGTLAGTNGGEWMANLTVELAANGLGSSEYTALLLPSGAPLSPPGYGYLLMTNHAGVVTLSGALADGTVFSQTVPMSGLYDLPVYGNFYGSTGLLIGWIGLESGAPAGSLTWIREASHFSALYTNGFTNVDVVQGSLWTNPLPKMAAIDLPAGALQISGGGLSPSLTFNAGVSNNNTLVKLAGSPTNSLSGSINPKTGLLTITFGNGAGKATTAGTGAVLQDANNAGGYFLGKTNAGGILLQP
jgi:hypothetical protein